MWIEAIVMPREETVGHGPLRPPGRSDVHERGCAQHQRFRDSLMAYLRAHNLLSAVKWVSEQGALPVLTLHCTPGVLEQLRRAPEFQAGRSLSPQLHI